MSPFFFVPNLIGYLRVALMIFSFYLMQIQNVFALLVYSVSCLLDAFDGFIARALKQSTRFGAVLDMVTDRSTTCGLLVFLAILYPIKYAIIFQLLLALDISSHYMIMYSSLSSGLTSHKETKSNYPWILRLYYESRVFLFVACAGNETFLISLYLRKAISEYKLEEETVKKLIPIITYISYGALPIFLFKQLTNIVQLVQSSITLVDMEKPVRNE